MACEGKCEQRPNKGIRRTWWCGFRRKGATEDHAEHDYQYRGDWFHCYG